MNSPSATSSFPADTLEAANEIIRVLREELAAVAVVVGRTKDGTGYDLDWFALHKDVQACRSETRVPDRDAIIEECAKVCDAQRNEVEAEYEKENESDLLAEAVMANYCASAIRDLKATPSATRSNDKPSSDWKSWRTARPMELEPWYCYWVSHLTSEGLHAKSDIATVLALLHRQADTTPSATRESIIEECAKFCELRAGLELCDERGFMRGDMGRELAAALRREYVHSSPEKS